MALVEFQHISKIILITLEDNAKDCGDAAANCLINDPKIHWLPFLTSKYKSRILSQVVDHQNGYKQLKQLVNENDIRLVIAHGSPAGSIAYQVWRQTETPFFVSLFEPHADYMYESGVWNKYGLKYRFQKKWEHEQQKHAAGLMPVSECFKTKLLEQGMATEKVFVAPCSVNAAAFEFNEKQRESIRRQLQWEKAVIGIYVGKFGGLYYNEEASQIYQLCFKLISGFRLVILSPQPEEEITTQLKQYNLDLGRIYIASVPHNEVPAYLSLADFAFATYKPGPSKKYLSPVKVGEYWANGLPVLLTEGVGDDSDIINSEGGGATFNLQQEGSLEQAMDKIKQILNDPNHRKEIPKLAQKYRSPDRIREAYEYFFNRNGQV